MLKGYVMVNNRYLFCSGCGPPKMETPENYDYCGFQTISLEHRKYERPQNKSFHTLMKLVLSLQVRTKIELWPIEFSQRRRGWYHTRILFGEWWRKFLMSRPFFVASFLLQITWHEKENPTTHPIEMIYIAKHLNSDIFSSNKPRNMISHVE